MGYLCKRDLFIVFAKNTTSAKMSHLFINNPNILHIHFWQFSGAVAEPGFSCIFRFQLQRSLSEKKEFRDLMVKYAVYVHVMIRYQ